MERLIVVILVSLLSGCGGEAPPEPRAPEPPAKEGPDPLEGMTVYDASGAEHRCERPKSDYPPLAPNPDFDEACRLGGFRVQKCGCESMCTGRAAKSYYDAEGKPKACAPEGGDCTPPAAPAAFQDACAERGFKLEVCGCEWLCSGNPKPQ
jgi:hypothetical protein